MPRTGLTAQEIRVRAIEATLGRMRRHGFDKVRLADIAKDLGVSHTALYPYFADKSALFDAVTGQWLRETEAALTQACQSDRAAIERIEDWFLTMYRLKRDRISADPELFRAFDNAASSGKPAFLAYRARIIEQLSDLVKEAARWLDNAGAERKVALLMEGMVAFYHPKLLVEHYQEDRTPLLRDVLDALLRGAGLGPAGPLTT